VIGKVCGQTYGAKNAIAEDGCAALYCHRLVAARFSLKCDDYIGREDIVRHIPNVFWMKQLVRKRFYAFTTGAQTYAMR